MRRSALALALVITTACSSHMNVSPGWGMQPTGEWRTLFDGTSTSEWRAFRGDSFPSGWHIEDGALVRRAEAGDIVTREEFHNFELELDWKVAEGSNSGIMYRVSEAAEAPYETGPEYQVLDDARHPDGKLRLTAAGSLFGLYPSPAGIVKPAGEWNHARIVLNGNHVEHWLNGVQTVGAEIGSANWNQRVAASKFHNWPGFGTFASGHIDLQDHGDEVYYRNIRIKVLP